MTTPQEATEFALIYGLPLLHYATLANKIKENLDNVFTTNAFYHQPKLASPTFGDINRPNVDTLYSEALVDLSSQNLIVTIPHFIPDDRFYVFPFYDVYGNNFVNLGPAGDSSKAGKYLVSFRYAKPGYEEIEGSDYKGHIYMPTPYGAIDLRIQVNGHTDVPTVRKLQERFTLETAAILEPLVPELTQDLLPDGLSIKEPEGVLQLTASLSLYCPPEVASDIPMVVSTLRIAGLEQGYYQQPPTGVDLESATEDAIEKIGSVYLSDYDTYFKGLGNDWGRLYDKYSGDFTVYYLARAFVAAEGYLQLKATQAIYPIYKSTSTPRLTPFSSDNSYTVTFSAKPPVSGFWSLTVYNEKAELIKNEYHIYSRGDRSDLKDINGDPVYGSGSESDVEFVIYLQSTNPGDDKFSKYSRLSHNA